MNAVYNIMNSNGFLSQSDKAFLGLMASRVTPPDCVVEVGTYHGGSAKLFRAAAAEGVEVHTVDIVERPQIRNDLESRGICVFQGTSRSFSDQFESSAGLLFIDGCHSFKNALDDFLSLKKIVSTEGLVAFHDYDNRLGVRVVVDTMAECGVLKGRCDCGNIPAFEIDQTAALPGADDYSRVLKRFAEMDRVHRGAESDFPGLRPYMLTASLEEYVADPDTLFIGRGGFGWFVMRMFDLSPDRFIDSSQLTDPSKKYVVLSASGESIYKHFNINGPHLSELKFLPPRVFFHLIVDGMLNGDDRLLKVCSTELEKDILRKSFYSMSHAELGDLAGTNFFSLLISQFFGDDNRVRLAFGQDMF